MRAILIIINGDLNDNCAHHHRLIVNRAGQTGVVAVTMIANSGIVRILEQLPIEFERTFVLGEDPLSQDLEGYLLDDKWRANHMRVVAISESGTGARRLRLNQLIKAGPRFDKGLLSKKVPEIIDHLLPRPCNA